jgi:hypothetical protein
MSRNLRKLVRLVEIGGLMLKKQEGGIVTGICWIHLHFSVVYFCAVFIKK